MSHRYTSHRTRVALRYTALSVAAMCTVAFLGSADTSAQRAGGPGGARAGGPPAPRTGRTLAPIDLTGTWVSVITEDWRWRMATPPAPSPNPDVASVPVSAEGRKVAAAWNLAADNAAGNQCKAFGVGGIMRQPTRVRVSWQDDDTLKMEFDAGTQTRLLNFSSAAKPPAEKTWQGFSFALWEGPGVGRGGAGAGDGRNDARVTGGGLLDRSVPGGGGGGLRGAPPPRQQAQLNVGGSLKVTTTSFREGYLRKNGVAYSEQAHDHRVHPSPADASERRQLDAGAHHRRGSALPLAAVLHQRALPPRGERHAVQPGALPDRGAAARDREKIGHGKSKITNYQCPACRSLSHAAAPSIASLVSPCAPLSHVSVTSARPSRSNCASRSVSFAGII